jgi:ATP-binding cassette subfamily B protein
LKKPQLLILDEATSALDYFTEKQIDFVINHNQTTLIITHRLENLKTVDKIYMLNNGELIPFSYNEAIADALVVQNGINY